MILVAYNSLSLEVMSNSTVFNQNTLQKHPEIIEAEDTVFYRFVASIAHHEATYMALSMCLDTSG